MTNDLVPVDIDLIKRLRFEQKHEEADALLRTFRNNCRKQKYQERREQVNICSRVAYLKRHSSPHKEEGPRNPRPHKNHKHFTQKEDDLILKHITNYYTGDRKIRVPILKILQPKLDNRTFNSIRNRLAFLRRYKLEEKK